MIDFAKQHEEFASWLVAGCSKGKRKREGDAIRGNCPCPEHPDRNPSFSYDIPRGVWACSCGGGVGSELWKRVGYQPANGHNGNGSGTLGEIVATYDYRDDGGKTLFQVVRYAPKTFRQRKPDGKGGWMWNLGNTPRVPYRLPELLKSAGPVLIVEGEKDVDNAYKQGFTATCNSGGALRWNLGEYAQYFRGREVFIVPDNDGPSENPEKHFKGLRHALEVQEDLKRVAKAVHVLPFLRVGKDFSDFIAAGGTTQELQAVMDEARSGKLQTPSVPPKPAGKPSLQEGGPFSLVPLIKKQEWDPPIALAEYKVPDFPDDVLPKWANDFVDAIAAETESPRSMAAMTALGCIAAAASQKAIVRVNSGWSEQLNIFVASALATGTNKTGVLSRAKAPIEEFEKERLAAAKEKYLIDKALYSAAGGRLKRAQEEAANPKSSEEQANQAHERIRDAAKELSKLKEPFLPRLSCDDPSPERVVGLLRENHGRMAVLSDEGAFFANCSGRYSKGEPNFEKVLQSYTGQRLQVDRVGRGYECVEKPALTIVVCVQPDVVSKLLDVPGMKERGFLARFFYVVPHNLTGHRRFDGPPADPIIVDSYSMHLRAILSMHDRENSFGELEPLVLTVTELGKELVRDYRKENEPKLREDGELHSIVDWILKSHGSIIRIAGLLHIAKNIKPGEPDLKTLEIEDETIDQAQRIVQFLTPHTLAAYGFLGADATTRRAKWALEWFKRMKLSEFTKRKLHLAMTNQIRKAKELDAPLELLEEHGFIRRIETQEEPTEKRKRGRPPGSRYEINPTVLETKDSGENVKGAGRA